MRSNFLRRALAPVMGFVLLCTMAAPSSAFFWSKKETGPAVADVSKNVIIGDTLSFTAGDFTVTGGGKETLAAITITSLPDRSCGILCVGSQALAEGAVVRSTALDGLRFQTMPISLAESTAFTFLPTFSSGAQGEEVTVDLYLLKEENQAPIAENMSLCTYKNVPITGYFQAVDAEGDPLVFQITSNPARGSVALAEDGTSRFVYTPYENKTGKDSFTYVAMDSAGNLSNPAKVSIRIEKAGTTVTYADMEGSPAYKAALRLAEEGIFVGEYVNGQYFFHPDETVTRGEFLAMAMSVAGLEPLKQVSVTGFADDAAIPTWCKGYVSSALKAGAVRGSRDEEGRVVFCPDSAVTRAEATVMLNNLLQISDVAVQTWAAAGVPEDTEQHWAAQAAVNLTTAGILRSEDSGSAALDTRLTRADVAEMLDSSLDVLSARENSRFLFW